MQFTIAACTAALLGLASAQNVHVVSVGSTNGSLIFSPDNIKANSGEMIQFQFRAGNHSVVQSTFDAPCTPISQTSNRTGIFSGYQPVAASEAMGMIPTYTIMVTDNTPLWLYCSQGRHCQSGMVMVVNENPGANVSRTLTQYKSLAAQATANLAPGGSSTGGSTGSDSGSGTTDSGSGSTTTDGGSTSTSDSASASGTAVATGAGSVLAITSSMGLLSAAAAALLLL
ncbi:hypothetical protein F5X99DRAFT_73070 [Biscogniauxia marginata]|nr:hypothetical protein F5X99DRAFT_73070 [Biscogniauxia marginata]